MQLSIAEHAGEFKHARYSALHIPVGDSPEHTSHELQSLVGMLHAAPPPDEDALDEPPVLLDELTAPLPPAPPPPLVVVSSMQPIAMSAVAEQQSVVAKPCKFIFPPRVE